MSKQKTIHNFVEFDCLLGIDIGATLLFLKKYLRSDYVNPVYHSTLNTYYNMIIWREEKNPLKLVLKKQYHEYADALLAEFLGKYEEEIYLNSPVTEVLKYMNFLLNDDDNLVKCVVNCHSRIQEKIIRKLMSKATIEIGRYDITGMSTLFIDDLEDLPKYHNVDGKYLYLMMKKRNINDNWLVKELPGDPAVIIRVIQQYDGLLIPLDTKGVMVDEQSGDTIRLKDEHSPEINIEKITIEKFKEYSQNLK